MDNKIKYNLIILFQIKEKDGHIEYVFRLSEKTILIILLIFKLDIRNLGN